MQQSYSNIFGDKIINLMKYNQKRLLHRKNKVTQNLEEIQACSVLKDESEREVTHLPSHSLAYMQQHKTSQRFTTWAEQQQPLRTVDQVQIKVTIKRPLVMQRNQLNLNERAGKLQIHHKKICELVRTEPDDRSEITTHKDRAQSKSRIIREKCAISLVSPKFTASPEGLIDLAKSSGGLLTFSRERSHERRNIVIKKIKRDLMNGFELRKETNNFQKTIQSQSPRQNICSEIFLRLNYKPSHSHRDLLGDEMKSRLGSNLTTRHKKRRKIFTHLATSDQSLQSQSIQLPAEYKMIQSLLIREKHQNK